MGSFVVGKAGLGIGQIILWGLGFLLTLTGILAIIGIPLMIGAWIWGIITAEGSGNNQPQQINMIQQVGLSNTSNTPERIESHR